MAGQHRTRNLRRGDPGLPRQVRLSPFDGIEHEEGDGTRPAAMLTFSGLDPTALGELQQRVHNMYWKKRKLGAQVMRDRFA